MGSVSPSSEGPSSTGGCTPTCSLCRAASSSSSKTPHRLLKLVPLGSHSQIQPNHGVMTFSVLMGSVEEWPMKIISSQETLTCSLSAPSRAFGQLFSLIFSPYISVCPYRACSHKPAHRAFMANWVLPLTRGEGRKEGKNFLT